MSDTAAARLDRASIRFPLTPWERVVEALAVLCVLIGINLVAFNYASLPSRVPIHFNAAGQPNGYGPKAAAWILPITSAILFLAMAGASRVSLQWYNVPVRLTPGNAERQYKLARGLVVVMNLLCAILFAGLSWAVVATAKGAQPPIGAWGISGTVVAFGIAIAIYFILALRHK